MENQEQNQAKNRAISASLLASAIVFVGIWMYATGFGLPQRVPVQPRSENQTAAVLPVRWGDVGLKMINVGVIDRDKFEELYANRGGLDAETENLLNGNYSGNLKITAENSGVLLNLLWALGLAEKSDILERGEMADPRYGGAGRFASTGGWTLARDSAMNHYARHQFIALSPDQQALVDRISKNIYRPCCDNPTHFPDCNHGMAMLGLLEIMASQGVSEKDMYKTALLVSSYWFPDVYLTVARYLASGGHAWTDVDPQIILGRDFYSGSGYRQVLKQMAAPEKRNGGSCGV